MTHTMSKRPYLILAAITAVFIAITACALETDATERIRVIREAKEDSEAAVAVEGFTEKDIFSVKVTVRIEGATPNIYSVLLVGPNLGRMSPTSIESLYAVTEQEEPYQTIMRGAFISFGNDAKSKSLQGRVTRKRAEYRIPAGTIKPEGDYQIWVRVESSKKRGRITTYRFDLEEFPELFNK
jgi:hypothetical protein